MNNVSLTLCFLQSAGADYPKYYLDFSYRLLPFLYFLHIYYNKIFVRNQVIDLYLPQWHKN